MVNWTNAYWFGITLETVYRNGQKIKVFVKDHSFERREKCRANKQKSEFVGFHETEALWRSHFFQHFTHSNIDNISKQHVHIISTRSLFNDETIEKEWSKRYTFDRLMFNRCFFFLNTIDGTVNIIVTIGTHLDCVETSTQHIYCVSV